MGLIAIIELSISYLGNELWWILYYQNSYVHFMLAMCLDNWNFLDKWMNIEIKMPLLLKLN